MPPPRPGPLAVRLRPVADADLALFFAHQADPIACELAAYSPRDERAFHTHWSSIRADPTILTLTVLAGERVAGNVGSWGPREARLVGYWLDRELWGRGIATRALAAFLELETTRPLYAHVARGNLPSRRVLEKCGFVASGKTHIDDDGVEELVLVLAR